jgi:methyl-accepting chemotaxis protein
VLEVTSHQRSEAAVSQQGAITAMTAQTATSRQLSLLTSAGAIGLGLALAVAIGRGIAGPIVRLTAVMRRLAGGDTGITIPGRGGSDEIAAMAEAVEVFRCNAIETARLVAERETVRAAKERRQAAMDRHVQEFGASIGGVMANLTDSATQMRGAAEAVSEAAGRTRISAATTEEEASVSSRDLEAVAAAAEQMSGSIAEISRQAGMVTQAVQHAAEQATITDHKVADLAETASQIGQVARLIGDIAGRTNLLALNATIEAARAGEAGKGFAVVASEVKALAMQTARATEQIGSQIAGIRGTTSEAVGAVQAVTRSIVQVDATAAAIAAAVTQQSAATREISGNAQGVMRSAGRSAEAMRAVLAVAEESKVASQMVLSVADEVGRTADTLRGEVQQFLRAMLDSDETQQRRYERIPGSGSRATLYVPGRAEVELTIHDISRGGVALECDWQLPPGSEAALVLSGSTARVAARVSRADRGVLALTVRQDVATLAQLDQALDTIRRLAQRNAA